MTEPTPKPYLPSAAPKEPTKDELRDLRALVQRRVAYDYITLSVKTLRALLEAYDELQRRKSERDLLGDTLNNGDGTYRP